MSNMVRLTEYSESRFREACDRLLEEGLATEVEREMGGIIAAFSTVPELRSELIDQRVTDDMVHAASAKFREEIDVLRSPEERTWLDPNERVFEIAIYEDAIRRPYAHLGKVLTARGDAAWLRISYNLPELKAQIGEQSGRWDRLAARYKKLADVFDLARRVRSRRTGGAELVAEILEYATEGSAGGYDHEVDDVVQAILSIARGERVEAYASDPGLKDALTEAMNAMSDDQKRKLLTFVSSDPDIKNIFYALIDALKACKKNHSDLIFASEMDGLDKNKAEPLLEILEESRTSHLV